MSKAILTIDDISTNYTLDIIDYLTEKRIKPIMFSVGQNVEQHFEEAIYALSKGAIIGNHSYSHPHFSELTVEEGIDEIRKQEEVVERLYKVAGVERKFKIFRFPYGDKGGNNKEAIQAFLKENKFCRIDDSNINLDWYTEQMLNKEIDILWTFDFEEYRLNNNDGFTYDSIIHLVFFSSYLFPPI